MLRDHGSVIGNRVHHRRDVSFQEDGCRVRHRVVEKRVWVPDFRQHASDAAALDRCRGQPAAPSNP